MDLGLRRRPQALANDWLLSRRLWRPVRAATLMFVRNQEPWVSAEAAEPHTKEPVVNEDIMGLGLDAHEAFLQVAVLAGEASTPLSWRMDHTTRTSSPSTCAPAC